MTDPDDRVVALAVHRACAAQSKIAGQDRRHPRRAIRGLPPPETRTRGTITPFGWQPPYSAALVSRVSGLSAAARLVRSLDDRHRPGPRAGSRRRSSRRERPERRHRPAQPTGRSRPRRSSSTTALGRVVDPSPSETRILVSVAAAMLADRQVDPTRQVGPRGECLIECGTPDDRGRSTRAGRCGPSCSCPGSGRRRSSGLRRVRTSRIRSRGSPTNSRSSSSSGSRTFSSVWVVRNPSWHHEERASRSPRRLAARWR